MTKIQYKSTDFFKDKPLDYGFVKTPYGEALLVMQAEALVALTFVDKTRTIALAEIKVRLKTDRLSPNKTQAEKLIKKIKAEQPVAMILSGPDFFQKVWRALMRVPAGATTTYGALAAACGAPKGAARAVGQAMNKNKCAWVVPCHRVVGSKGALHGYRYGLSIKEKILQAEGAVL